MRAFARETGLFLLAALATLPATWPLGRHLLDFERLADRTLDDHVYWWDFWWLHEALLVRGCDPFFCPDVFWPHGASLVISPFALPFGLLSLPLQAAMGELPGAVAAVKLLGFLTFPFALLGVSLLLRRLGAPLLPSLLAGAFFAFAPFRILHLGRIHYLAAALLPWFLHSALLAMQTRRGRWFVAAAVWFALAAASDASLLLEMTLAAGALWGFELLRRERGFGAGAATLRLLACGLAGALLLSPLLARFLAEARANEGADVAARLDYEEEPGTVQRLLSPDLDGLLWYLSPALHEAALARSEERGAPPILKSSARLTADVYESLRPPGERGDVEAAAAALAVLVVSAAVALGARERGAWPFLLLALVGFALALGPKRGSGEDAVSLPYAWLARVVPGMAAGRYPAAHLRLLHLGIAIAGGLAFLCPRGALLGAGGLALGAFLACGPLRPLRFEPIRPEEVHERIAADAAPGAVLELPPRREIVLRRMALGQIVHRRALISGPLTRVPKQAWSFFNEEPVVQRLLHPPPPANPDDPALEREIEENRAALVRHGVRFLVVRRALFGADPDALGWLLHYLRRHGFRLESTREGHVLVTVDS
jgi:hypothetical protein